MPQYAILIFDEERPDGVEELPSDVLGAHTAVGARITQLGARLLHAHALQPADTATTIHSSGLLSDGPFVEAKEMLAGVFIIDAQNLDVALAIGRAVPTLHGAVEVRPLLGTPDAAHATSVSRAE